MGIIDKMMGIEKINYLMVQKDEEENYIIYPIPMFPIKGYIAPDEEAAIKFTNRMYPIIGLSFGVFMLAGHFSDFYFLIAVILYFLLISIINLRLVKNFPISKRKYSWKYYADQMNKKRSTFFLCFALLLLLLFCWMIIYDQYYFGNKSTGYYIFAMSVVIYVLILCFLTIFYRIKSLF